MTGVIVEIPHNKWSSQRNLKLDKSFRDALADLWRLRWPTHTAKYAAREYGLSVDRAREGVAGRASLTTIEQVMKRGGIGEALALCEAVTGQSVTAYFAELRKAHDEQGARITALAGAHLPLAADRPAGDPDTSSPLAGGDRIAADRSLRQRG